MQSVFHGLDVTLEPRKKCAVRQVEPMVLIEFHNLESKCCAFRIHRVVHTDDEREVFAVSVRFHEWLLGSMV